MATDHGDKGTEGPYSEPEFAGMWVPSPIPVPINWGEVGSGKDYPW